MKKTILVIAALAAALNAAVPASAAAKSKSKPVVVAHRGFWDCDAAGRSQNSIASLKAAAENGFWGCELDIHMTSDSCVLVNHDGSIKGKAIAKNPISAFDNDLLPNGERRPTLKEYLEVAANYPKTVFVIEFKQNNPALIEKTVALLREYGMMSPERVAFIAFSYDVCLYVAKHYPGFTNQYLNGDKSPKQLKDDGINGLDYHFKVLRAHKKWVAQAHRMGLSVNCWTVNNDKDMDEMIGLGVDAITTNRPLELTAKLSK